MLLDFHIMSLIRIHSHLALNIKFIYFQFLISFVFVFYWDVAHGLADRLLSELLLRLLIAICYLATTSHTASTPSTRRSYLTISLKPTLTNKLFRTFWRVI